MSRIVSVQPVFPPHAYPQQEITEVIVPLLSDDPVRRDTARRTHAHAGVDVRHLTLPIDQYAALGSFAAANAVFHREGVDLAVRACAEALARAGIGAGDVDYLLFTTVTGIAVPSLDAEIAELLALRADVRRLPSFGLGCAAGAAALAHADALLHATPAGVALVVSVELCSLTFTRDDSAANLAASGLFGDGASAVVLVGDRHRAGGPAAVIGARSRLHPGTARELGWDITDTGWRVVLSPRLPQLLRAHLLGDVKALLADHGLDTHDVATWIVHAGGPRIIDAVRDALGLDESQVHRSRQTLAAEGNLSSSSVLHVLAATLEEDPTPGPAVLMAFGPGVGVEIVLLDLGSAPAPTAAGRAS